MKAFMAIAGLLIVLGLVYALAFFGILPTQKMAEKNASLMPIFTKLHLAKAKKHVLTASASAPVSPEQQAFDSQKKKLAADQAQLAKDQAAFESEKQTAAAPGPNTPNGDTTAPIASDNVAKLNAIYATMSADDISHILAKLPDPDVIQTLTQLDEKKAGQVLTSLPVDRAARISRQMAHTEPHLQNASQTLPATAL